MLALMATKTPKVSAGKALFATVAQQGGGIVPSMEVHMWINDIVSSENSECKRKTCHQQLALGVLK